MFTTPFHEGGAKLVGSLRGMMNNLNNATKPILLNRMRVHSSVNN
jgi:hypothetical protein